MLMLIIQLVKTKTNSKYLIGCSDKTIRPAVLIMLQMSAYVKTYKIKDKKNSLMSFCLDMRSYQKNRKLFGITLKILEILNYMIHQSMIKDI